MSRLDFLKLVGGAGTTVMLLPLVSVLRVLGAEVPATSKPVIVKRTNMVGPDGVAFLYPTRPNGFVWFGQPMFNLYRTTEKDILKNFKYVAMKIPKHPTRSIISNMKTVVKQVNRLLPSVIYVDISYLNQKMKMGDFDKLEEQIEGFLRKNPAVNAVVITDKYKTGREGAVEIKNGLWIVRNPITTHKLPKTFRIPYEEVSSKQSLISDNYWV